MNKEKCALKLVDEIILYYDARSKKYQIQFFRVGMFQINLQYPGYRSRLVTRLWAGPYGLES